MMTSKHVTNVIFLKKYLSSTLHETTNLFLDTMKFLVCTFLFEQ